ncbi:hypothetical protein A0H81_10858 [Grifola frondosa]|uniref:Uncharacterized protein n=1 Tax=Grifola frondosa TaxID=5627 RepID=A0A1C7LWK1_GRIFR|nr:hypothetical protein A0H81_10858 [Grifola frondosa]
MLQLSQSEASASSLKTPSALARNATLFLNWRADVKIWQENPCVEAKTLYNQLREFRLPKWLNDIDVPREDVIEGEGDFYRELKEWGGQQHDPSVDNADTYHLHTFLPMLCLSFIRIKNSKLQNEASQGRRIDDIIEFAFGLKKGRKFDVFYDSHIRLRKSPNVAVSPNAIADTLVTFPVTNLKGRPVLSDVFLRTAGPAAAPNVSWSPDPPDDISVIVFPSEYKRLDLDTNCNRIIIDFCTAQSQRRSLGAEDDIIFGMAAAGGEAVIYSCWWEGDEMCYAKHEAWMLTNPRQFIELYVFLCNLAEHARKSLQTMFASSSSQAKL